MNENGTYDENIPTPDFQMSGEAQKRRPFRRSVGTYIVLVFLVILLPGFNILISYIAGTDLDFGNLDPILTFFVPTVVFLWLIVLIILLALWREKSSLASIGMGIPTLSHVGLGILFFFVTAIALGILQFLLQLLDIPFSSTPDQILAIAGKHEWWWLIVCITAALCEEVTYRGYLMSRLKGLTDKGWLIPIIVSVFAFTTGHLYQGIGGVVVIAFYATMFCGLYIMTGSVWPGIIAHFLQDFSALYIYQLGKHFGF